MRVVDDDQERLASAHLLETPGHGADGAERPGDGRRLETEGQPHTDGPEEVHHVVLTDQRRREVEITAWRACVQPDALKRGRVLDGTDPSAGSQAERERRDIKTLHHLGPGRIVSIHDRGASGLRRLSEQLEQTTLRPTVLIERAMKIEMILCQVG